MTLNATPLRLGHFPPGKADLREILRYAKSDWPPSDELSGRLQECLEESSGCLADTVVWRLIPLKRMADSLDFGFAVTESRDLAANLEGCDAVVMFAATLGIGIDRLITRYGRVTPLKSLLFQAIGAERIEALCDAFNGFVEQEYRGRKLHTRFSPGYGDLPLAMQMPILETLDAGRRIGLTLNESLLMSPSKSVTAFIGIE